MKKKILATSLIAAMVLTMSAGCGSEKTSTSTASVSESKEGTSVSSESESTSSEGESERLKAIKEKGYITIATSNDAPFAYIDVEDGQLKGLDVDILKEICNRLGIPDIQAETTDFNNMLIELNNGNVDMVADAMYIKDERLDVAYFTDVWYQESEAVTIRSDSEFKTKESLKDATVAATAGAAMYETCQQWLDAGKIKELVSYESQSLLLTAVSTGKVDACVTDGIVSGYTIMQNPDLGLELMSPYEPECAGRIGAAIRFEDKDFLDEVNGALNAMKEDGTLLSILESYGLNEDYFVGVEDGKTENHK